MFKRPSYCTQTSVEDCRECSLTNYGLDCSNNPADSHFTDDPAPEGDQASAIRMQRITGTVTYNCREYVLHDFYTPGTDDLSEIKEYTRTIFEHMIRRDNPGLAGRPLFRIEWTEQEANP
jgi:hypothetical protein